MDPLPIDDLRAQIEDVTGPARPNGRGGWNLRCPAHSDRNPSLTLDQNEQHHALVLCQAGCSTDDVLAAIGRTRRDLYPKGDRNRRETDPVVATYRYTDEHGSTLYEVLRTASKRFRQRRPDPASPGGWAWKLGDVRRVLYRLPIVLDAIANGLPVYLVEGEKDVHTIEALGHVATTNPGGAGRGKWRPEYTETLRGAHVVAITDRDRDGQGLAHMLAIRDQVAPVAASFVLLQPRAGKDTTDHVTAGLELDDMTIVPADLRAAVPPADGKVTEPVSGAPISPVEVPAAEDGGRQIRLTAATEFEIRAVQWLWDGRMPIGELCLIPGREGVGKSTFLAWLARAITRGELPGVYAGEPRAVLYAASEDAWGYTIAPRMVAAGADLSLIYRIDTVEDGVPGGLLLPRDCSELAAIAEQYKAAVLMCDPILSLVDDRLNINRAQELRKALEPLKRAAEAAGLAIPALIHFNKTSDTDASSRIAGSRAWAEVARAIIAIAHDEDAEDRYTCVVSQIKNNLGRLDLPHLTYTILDAVVEAHDGSEAHVGRLQWTGESSISAAEVLGRRPGVRRDPTAAEQILQVLHDTGRAMTPRDIREAIGDVSEGTVRSALSRMRSRGQVVVIAGGTLYRLPDDSDSE